MSIARNNRRKETKELRTEDERRVLRQIRKGEMPRFHFVKQSDGVGKLETVKKQVRKGWKIVRTWRQISTLKALVGKK